MGVGYVRKCLDVSVLTALTSATVALGPKGLLPQMSHTVCPALKGLLVSMSTRILFTCPCSTQLPQDILFALDVCDDEALPRAATIYRASHCRCSARSMLHLCGPLQLRCDVYT